MVHDDQIIKHVQRYNVLYAHFKVLIIKCFYVCNLLEYNLLRLIKNGICSFILQFASQFANALQKTDGVLKKLLFAVTLINPHMKLPIYIVFFSYSHLSQFLYLIQYTQIINHLQIMFTTNIARRIYYFSKISKIVNNVSEALADVNDKAKILVGGFGICGVPMNLIAGLREKGIKDLTIVSNNCGVGDKQGKTDWGLGILLRSGQIKRMISSYVGQNAEFQRQYLSGQLQLQITPQGTLAEKIRSGGAGIPAFYTATGVGTLVQTGGFPIKYKKWSEPNVPQIVAKPKIVKKFNGKSYIQQETIFGDVALVKAKKADTMGNLYFSRTANNFNADMATAAKLVIAEVQQIVEPGQISPQYVHVPAVYVNKIFKSDPNCVWSQKKIQKRTVQKQSQSDILTEAEKKRLKIIKRAAQQVKNGMNVNLGIGIPTLLPSVLPKNIQISLQSENGIFGVGPYPTAQGVDPDLINAGKETVTILPGGSLFSSSKSFAIIRGGHLDLTMLGALQVSRTCDIANWIIPGKLVKGMGGAMDLVACGSEVIVVMEHSNKSKKTGILQKKILDKCNLPLTAKGVVNMVITELAVFQNIQGELILTQIAHQTTLQEVQNQTGFDIKCAPELKRF